MQNDSDKQIVYELQAIVAAIRGDNAEIQSVTNSGTLAGTIYYTRFGELKIAFSTAPAVTLPAGFTTKTVVLPSGFFTAKPSFFALPSENTVTGSVFMYIDSSPAPTKDGFTLTMNNTASAGSSMPCWLAVGL